MNRSARTSLIVAGVLVLGYPAAAWFLGLLVEHQLQTREQEQLAMQPYLTVVKRDYHHGVYTSTEEVTYALGGPYKKWLDVQFTLRSTLHHGPLPQLHSFAPATADTEWVVPPKLQQPLHDLTGGKPLLTAHTRMNWLGGSVTVLQSPAFAQRDISGLTVSSGGLQGRIEAGRDIGTATTSFTAPGFTIQSPNGTLSADGLKLDSVTSPYLPRFPLGRFETSVAHMSVESAKSGKVAVRNLALRSNATAAGELVDIDMALAADAVEAMQNSVTQLLFELRLGHVHAPSLLSLNESLRAARTSADDKPDPVKVKEALKSDGIELLVRGPVVEIPHFDFKTPDGAAQLSIKATAPGITRADVEGSPLALRAAFVKHARITADMRIDTPLLDKLIDNSGKADSLTAQLQGLQRQGYLKLEGQTMTTHIVYRDGQLRVNDLPFPPQPAAH